MRRSSRFLLSALATLGLVGASCGSDDPDSGDTSRTTVGTTEARPTEEPAATVASKSVVSGDVTVFAAASLTESFSELGEAFMMKYTDVDVTFNFASSSDLATQLNEGAPADVFASADQANMSKLTDAGNNGNDPVVFATNALEIIVGPGNPEGITGVADLADPDLIVVTCALEVPIGKYSAEAFAKAGVTVTPKSFEENVKAVVSKVTLGEADAGIVYRTDVIAAGDQAEGVEIPDDLNVIAEYPLVVAKEAPNADAGQAFVDFVLSGDGRTILASHGFTAP